MAESIVFMFIYKETFWQTFHNNGAVYVASYLRQYSLILWATLRYYFYGLCIQEKRIKIFIFYLAPVDCSSLQYCIKCLKIPLKLFSVVAAWLEQSDVEMLVD